MHRVGLSGAFRYPCLVAACILLAAFLLACGGNDTDAAASEKMLLLEAKAHSLEESLEALHEENASTRSELAALEQEQADFMRERKEAETSEKHVEEVADSEEGQEEQLAALEEGLARADERFDGLETRLLDLEGIASQVDLVLPAIEKWFKGMDQRLALMEGTTLERTARLAESAGGEVYYIDSREPEERAILVMPLEPIDGGPLIVSLHGYGGNSADHSLYIPLHERVNEAGFGLLLPNGTHDSQGNRSWNPTDQSSQSGKDGADDVAYLADLVARALEVKGFGPVYLFGYSNGGFMSYHMACKSLPGLRAVVSLAGTSYVEDSSCDGAPPVSVLHIHGSTDDVILYQGKVAEPVMEGDGKSTFYVGAQEMFTRWGQRAGCDLLEHPQPYATLDLDENVPGPETQAYRLESGCAEGINVELWMSEGSGHSPGYGDAFADALLEWLLAQR